MGLPRLAQQAPSTQTSFQLSVHQHGHSQTARSPSFKHLELVSCPLGKCTASYHPQLCFQVWGPWMHRHNLHGGHSERNHGAYQNGLALQGIKLLQGTRTFQLKNHQDFFFTSKTTNSFEPWRYRRSWPIHCTHQKDGTVCMGCDL